jgi:O-antigen ligase
MQTISTEGTRGGTGLDRKILWGWAWREFLSSPIYGVGTGNFGIAIFRVVSYGEALASGYTPGRLWGRVLHCAPMTVLCEYGLLGALVMGLLLADVLRTNRRTRKNANRFANTPESGDSHHSLLFRPSAVVAVSDGLNAAFIAIIVSAFFYELLYTPLLWHLIIINRLLYLVSLDIEPPGEPQLA